jgi:O-antigen/teichoic acid export membrane protein
VALHIESKDRDAFITKAFNYGVVFFLSIGLMIMAATPLLFPVFVASGFSEAARYIPILIVGAAFSAIVSLYGSIYLAKKLTKQVAITSIVAAVSNILLGLILIPTVGIYGAAFAYLITFASMAIYRAIDIRKYVIIRYDRRMIAILGLAYVTVGYLFYSNNLLLSICSVVIALLFSIYINKSSINFIKQQILQRKNNGGSRE